MKNKIITIIFFIIIIGTFILNIIIKDNDISNSERRKLTQFPTINIDNILERKTMDEFDNYAVDQFLLRDEYRAIKTLVNYNIFNKIDNNNITIKDNYIYKYEYPLKEDKVLQFTNKINKLYNDYLTNLNVYYTIIPDKNYFLNDNYLKLDYDKLISIVNDNIKDIKYIDITKDLSINDYYKTDTHWKQECLDNVIKTLSKNMNFNYFEDYEYNEYNKFYGVYYGQAAIKTKPETLTYLTNETINSVEVNDYESDLKTMYELPSLEGKDPYDVFLSGATPLITITNPNATTNKELLIFRDSFASSLAPILIKDYKTITLIDLRYMNSSLLNEYIEFNNQDVLIIYSTLLINNSDTLKIN